MEPHFRRIKLNSIDIRTYNINGISDTKSYSFQYYEGGDYILPPRHSGNIDMFGYYNGNSGPECLLPKVLRRFPEDDNENIFKGPDCDECIPQNNQCPCCYYCMELGLVSKLPQNPELLKTYVLKQITYPNEDILKLDYEAHQFIQNNTLLKGGGLRLKSSSITNSFGTQKYSYSYSSNGIDGVGILQNHIGYKMNVTLIGQIELTSQFDPNLLPSKNIFYNKVTVENELFGKIVFTYDGVSVSDATYEIDGINVFNRKLFSLESGIYFWLNDDEATDEYFINVASQYHPVLHKKTELYNRSGDKIKEITKKYTVLKNNPFIYYPHSRIENKSIISNLVIKPKSIIVMSFKNGVSTRVKTSYEYNSSYHFMPTKITTDYNYKNSVSETRVYNIDILGLPDRNIPNYSKLVKWNGVHKTTSRDEDEGKIISETELTTSSIVIANNGVNVLVYVPYQVTEKQYGHDILVSTIPLGQSSFDDRLNVLKTKNELTGHITTNTYVDGRLVLKLNNATSAEIIYQYNSWGQVTRIDYSDGSYKKNIQYDPYGRVSYSEAPGAGGLRTINNAYGDDSEDKYQRVSLTTITHEGHELPQIYKTYLKSLQKVNSVELRNYPGGNKLSSTQYNVSGRLKRSSTSGLSSVNFDYEHSFIPQSSKKWLGNMKDHKKETYYQIQYASDIGRNVEYEKVYVTLSYDENNNYNNPIKIYKNYKGEVICKDKFAQGSLEQRTQFYYDVYGRLINVVEDDGSTYQYNYSYDAGNDLWVTTKTDPHQIVTTIKTNLRGDVVEKSLPSNAGGTTVFTYHYNPVYYDLNNVKKNGTVILSYDYIRLSECGSNCIGKVGKLESKSVKILGTSDFIIYSYVYNDPLGRITATIVDNQQLGNVKVEILNYNHLDLAAEIRTTVEKGGNSVVYTEEFHYDDAGRLKYYQNDIFNNGSMRNIYGVKYTIADQVKKVMLGGFDQPLETVNYKYNSHGWLIAINDIKECKLLDVYDGAVQDPFLWGDNQPINRGVLKLRYNMIDLINGHLRGPKQIVH